MQPRLLLIPFHNHAFLTHMHRCPCCYARPPCAAACSSHCCPYSSKTSLGGVEPEAERGAGPLGVPLSVLVSPLRRGAHKCSRGSCGDAGHSSQCSRQPPAAFVQAAACKPVPWDHGSRCRCSSGISADLAPRSGQRGSSAHHATASASSCTPSVPIMCVFVRAHVPTVLLPARGVAGGPQGGGPGRGGGKAFA
jgi:hypothetical protein